MGQPVPEAFDLHQGDRLQLVVDHIVDLVDQTAYGSGHSAERLHQGAGAKGLSGLSAKLLLAVMPPCQPLFNEPAACCGQQLTEMSQDPQAEMSHADVALADIEQQVVKSWTSSKRTAIFELCSTCCAVTTRELCRATRDQDVGLQYCVSQDEGNVSGWQCGGSVKEFLPPFNTKDSTTAPPRLMSTHD